MNRYNYFLRFVCGLVVWFVAESRAASINRPNIIVLIADDLGVGDLGFSGAKDIPTPNLDRLAGEGIIFRNGYVSPMCAPTGAAFLSGCYPEKIGLKTIVRGIRGTSAWTNR